MLKLLLTDSNNEDVTTALVNPPPLILALTGAPNPIDESCRLGQNSKMFKKKKINR